jgi:4a-hydroxytetrahydrobiopterin dehydratase
VPGAPLAPSTEVRAALALLPGWTADRRALAKEYRFADWRGTMAFANRVSELANEVDHHPDAGGVTGNDLACAARTEIIALRTGSAGG